MRQIVLDTETTGLEVSESHRIIEVAALELVNREKTGKFLHFHLNPERNIDAGATRVHGMTNEFLKDKPKFASIADELLQFIEGAELLIHNAPFDLGFLNWEFSLWRSSWPGLASYCTVLDTLVLAREKHRGARNSLDALCKRYKVNHSHRKFHGALLDSELLAEVYLTMTGGQITLFSEEGLEPKTQTKNSEEDSATQSRAVSLASRDRKAFRVIFANEKEEEAHQNYLKILSR